MERLVKDAVLRLDAAFAPPCGKALHADRVEFIAEE
jgi:hypothetical protein